MADENYKDKISALNKTIERQQEMIKQMTSVITPAINTNCLNIQHYSNIMQSIVEYQKILSKKYNNISNISQSLQSVAKIVDLYQKYDFKGALIGIEKMSNIINNNIDYLSLSKKLENNINIINSIFYNLYNDNLEEINEKEANEILSKTQNIEFDIPFPEDTSIAEMEATINGEEYIEPDLDYKKFDVLLATMSFIDDPVKAANILSQVIYFADHSVDISFKLKIYSALKEQIAILIASGIIGIALFVIGVLLNYFLKDNEIYKKFIELRNSIKETKK